ncbi:hypothetical protein NUM3379_41520 [Kineococcus sp. NUM-3379]
MRGARSRTLRPGAGTARAAVPAALLAAVLACGACTAPEGTGPDDGTGQGGDGGSAVTGGTPAALPRGSRTVRPPQPPDPGQGSGQGAPWRPQPGQPWQWQLSGELDLTVDVPVYDVDWEVPREVVDRLHADGRRVVCYVSVGTVEDFRADARDFPEQVRGRPLEDWPDERWLDVRRLDVLGPLLARRLDACRDKGFDAVEPDNVDAYANDSGFPLTGEDQLRFNRWVAREAHARGMSVGLKNDLDQVPDLVGDFDFAVNEQCLQYDECDALEPFVQAGKAVLHVEYEMDPARFCRAARLPGFSSMLKRYDLDAWRHTCPGA